MVVKRAPDTRARGDADLPGAADRAFAAARFLSARLRGDGDLPYSAERAFVASCFLSARFASRLVSERPLSFDVIAAYLVPGELVIFQYYLIVSNCSQRGQYYLRVE